MNKGLLLIWYKMLKYTKIHQQSRTDPYIKGSSLEVSQTNISEMIIRRAKYIVDDDPAAKDGTKNGNTLLGPKVLGNY